MSSTDAGIGERGRGGSALTAPRDGRRRGRQPGRSVLAAEPKASYRPGGPQDGDAGIAAMLGSLSPDALRWALTEIDGDVLGEALEGLGADVARPALRTAARSWDTPALIESAGDMVSILGGRVLGGDLPDEVLNASVEELQRLERRVGGERLRRVREVAERGSHVGSGGRTTADLLARMGLTRGEAREQVDTAVALGAMPETAAKLAEGEIGLGHAGVVVRAAKELADHDAASGLDAEAAAERQERLDAEAARSCTRTDRGKVRNHLEDWKAREAPDLLAERERRAHRNRRLHKWRDDQGVGRLEARGPAAAHAQIAAALDALSRPTGTEDARSLEQRQYDALNHMAQAYLAEGELPEVAAVQPHVILTSSHEGLHGLPDAEPPRLDGVGPISSETAQMICCDAEMAVLRLGAEGEPLSIGRAQRRPTLAQRRAVIGRDRSCVGCGAPASRCQVHHVAWWRYGGRTDIGNLVLLCWNCHFHVHHHSWQVARVEGGYRAGPAGSHPTGATIFERRPARQPC